MFERTVVQADQGTRTLVRTQARVAGGHEATATGFRLRKRVDWLVPVVPAAVMAAAGMHRIGRPSLWRDEAATKAVTGRTVPRILATLAHTDAVHGAYYLTIHITQALTGNSAGALRIPSALAMTVACAFTALIARRLAVGSGSPHPSLVGVAAGLLFALTPTTVRYAQEARSYAIVTMSGAIATYLLLRAVESGRRWWVAYAAAVFLTGLFNIFALLIVPAHAISVLAANPTGVRIRVRWVSAAGTAVAALMPLAAIAYAQRAALGWVKPPQARATITSLADSLAGSPHLVIALLALAAAGAAATLTAGPRTRQLSTPVVAVCWLVLPPALLIGVSLIHPLYELRYVVFCFPAFAMLVATGIATVSTRAVSAVRLPARMAWLPACAVAATLVTVLFPLATTAGRARPDNLRKESAIITRHARPGDIVFYIPMGERIVSLPYPGSFAKLRDIALATSPVASGTLAGTDVSPAELLARFSHVRRVWVVWPSGEEWQALATPPDATPLDKTEVRLISGMHKTAQWRNGDVELTLYSEQP
jgi:mannosyltransferase